MVPKTAVIVGAGSRGGGYPWYAKYFPDQLKIVGVCEPRDYYRNKAIEEYSIPAENVFKDWTEAAEREKFADAVFICTPDRLHKPTGAADRCLDCPANIEESCPYSAKKIYLERFDMGLRGWPVSVICDGPVDIENVTKALRSGPYGKCVYNTDNDVVSHQVVNMQFEGGATAVFQMVAFTKKLCALEVSIYGTKGEMKVFGDQPSFPIQLTTFDTNKSVAVVVEEDLDVPLALSGHGGADYHIIKSFVDALHNPDSSAIETGPDDTLASHLLCFAAERARLENRVLVRNESGDYD